MLKKEKDMPNSAHQTRALCVVILPNNMQLQINVGLKSRGQDVISQISEILGITDTVLFGLTMQRDKDQLFLDLEKKLTTYFPRRWKQNTLPDRIVLHLKVQYYVRNDLQFVDEKICGLYCADLRNRVLNSQCYKQEGLYFQLAAYALQADLGDWNEEVKPYFKPENYFPPWILLRRGRDYVVQHTPDLHKDLRGMSAHDACLLFIEEACSLSDVPLTFYSMSKDKNEKTASVLLGLTLTGLHMYDTETAASGDDQRLNEFAWSSIDCIKFQGRRFEIRTDALTGKILVMYTQSVMHSQHLLKHMSNYHHLYLNRKERRHQREVCIRDSTDPDSEESEDELPSMKSYLENVLKVHSETKTNISVTKERNRDLADLDEIELCVDEPQEMFVDDPEEIIQLTELLDGVSVDGPPLTPMSQSIDFTLEIKQVLKWRACSLSLDQCRESVENLYATQLVSHEEHQHGQEDTMF